MDVNAWRPTSASSLGSALSLNLPRRVAVLLGPLAFYRLTHTPLPFPTNPPHTHTPGLVQGAFDGNSPWAGPRHPPEALRSVSLASRSIVDLSGKGRATTFGSRVIDQSIGHLYLTDWTPGRLTPPQSQSQSPTQGSTIGRCSRRPRGRTTGTSATL